MAYLAMTFTCFLVVVKAASDGGNLAIAQLAGLQPPLAPVGHGAAGGRVQLGGDPADNRFTGKFIVFNAAMERGYFLLVLIAMIQRGRLPLLLRPGSESGFPPGAGKGVAGHPPVRSTTILTVVMIVVIVVGGIFPVTCSS